MRTPHNQIFFNFGYWICYRDKDKPKVNKKKKGKKPLEGSIFVPNDSSFLLCKYYYLSPLSMVVVS